jgi:hypothetical protein
VSDKQSEGHDDELVRLIDADLSPEQVERAERHVAECSSCARELSELKTLVSDVRAPLPGAPLDVSAHVAEVMARLDIPQRIESTSRRALFGGALAAAAAAALIVVLQRNEPDAPAGVWTERGSGAEGSLSRNVGLTLYARESSLRTLSNGASARADVAFTAGLRNLGDEPVHLLLFALDAKEAVHWIAPEYTVAGTDPESMSVVPSATERLLPTAASFDDLAAGLVRVVAVITKEPRRVSEIEGLAASELRPERLRHRFPGADVRELALHIVPQTKRP